VLHTYRILFDVFLSSPSSARGSVGTRDLFCPCVAQVPKVKSITDASHFDPSGIEDHPNNGPIHAGTWDASF